MKRVVSIYFILFSLSLNAESYFKYRVERYDTVEKISAKFNVNSDQIESLNNIKDLPYLYVGQELEIPVIYNKVKPIDASLEIIMDKPISNWRNPTFELYQWDKKDKVLIFDTVNYSFQSLLFKRLAFFIEKKDYIGTIYTLDELQEERGWNGHDYKSDDLAMFFNKVKNENLTLTDGERILLDICLENRIIIPSINGYIGNNGAVLSCSRSSFYNLRQTILWHEALHGYYFTSNDFRSFVKGVWRSMDYLSQKIWKIYLELLQYDTTNEVLVSNEFMAYLLQLPEYETYAYFRQNVYYRLYEEYPKYRTEIDDFFTKYRYPYMAEREKLQSYIDKYNIK